MMNDGVELLTPCLFFLMGDWLFCGGYFTFYDPLSSSFSMMPKVAALAGIIFNN